MKNLIGVQVFANTFNANVIREIHKLHESQPCFLFCLTKLTLCNCYKGVCFAVLEIIAGKLSKPSGEQR